MHTPRASSMLGATFCLALAVSVSAGDVVRLELPVRSRVDTAQYRSIAIAPFALRSEEGSARSPEDLSDELRRHVRRTLERTSNLEVRLAREYLPTQDPEELVEQTLFWRAVGESAQADLVLAGAVDFDLQDRSGYVTREFVSDEDGRTYFAQVLVEEAGIELDLLFWVFDGQSGELLHAENFKDFVALDGESRDPLVNLFSSLEGMNGRLTGLFAARTVAAERVLQ